MTEGLDGTGLDSAPVRPAGLRATLARGTAWTASATLGASLLNIAIGLALTRVLAPADFGIQTAAVTVIAFAGALVDTALGTAVVQRRDLRQPELSSVYWTGLAASLVLCLLVAAAAPLAARLFGAAELRAALPVAALGILALGAAVVPTALLRVRLDFGTIARAQLAGALAGATAAALVALRGGGFWALILYSLVSSTVSSLYLCLGAGWRPSPTWSARHLAPLRGHAGSMTSFLTINYWSRNLDDLLIGRYLGVAPLGIFSLAQRLVGAPLQLLTGSLAPLLHPTFAAMGDDPARQRGAYLDLVRASATLTFPLAAVLYVLADPLVMAIGGERWMASAPVVRALCLLAAVQPVNMLSGALFMARDAAGTMLRCAAVGAVAVVAGMLYGLRHGVGGVAWGYSIAYLFVAAPVSTLVALRLVGGRRRELGRALWPPLATAAAVLAIELALARMLGGALPARVVMALQLLAALALLAAAAAPLARRIAGRRRLHGGA